VVKSTFLQGQRLKQHASDLYYCQSEYIRINGFTMFHDVSPTEMGNYAAEMNQLLNFREIAVRNNSGTLAAQMCKALPFHDARSSNKTWQWKIHH